MRSDKLKVLFLCTGNSCRSQIAEGFARALKGDVIEAYSAGVEPHVLNPLAVQTMAEAGVDIAAQKSKHVNDLLHIPFDYVVTVCGHANETCPIFPGKATILHVGFDDPPALAREAKSPEEALGHYRRVRDEIKEFILTLPESLSRIRLAAPRDKTKSGVLLLCVGNSARSQMAEGYFKHYAGNALDVHSAGTLPQDRIHPMAIQVMREAGIDISRQWPKGIRAYIGRDWFKYVISVCPSAEKDCPRIFMGTMDHKIWPIEDPAAMPGSDGAKLEAFRRVRDQIAARVKALLNLEK